MSSEKAVDRAIKSCVHSAHHIRIGEIKKFKITPTQENMQIRKGVQIEIVNKKDFNSETQK